MIVGDFNCKIGKHIANNKEEVSKYGKIFLKMVKQHEFAILNTHSKCVGTWTRIEGNKKSAIDYVITSKDDLSNLNKMIIDENKLCTPYHIVNKRTIYSDHCAIITEMNWYIAGITTAVEYKRVINQKNLNMFKEMTSQKTLTNIAMKKEKIDIKYEKWQNMVNKIMEKCFKKKVKYKPRKTKTIKRLHKAKREAKRLYVQTQIKNEENIKKYTVRNKLINKYIKEEQSKMKLKRINEEIKKLEVNGGLNSMAFWEFKKQMDNGKQKEIMNAVMDEQGELQTNKEGIENTFKEFYTKLFSTDNDKTSTTYRIEETIFKSIELMAENIVKYQSKYKNKNTIEIQEVENNINILKNKHTSDSQGWSNNMLKNSGSDVVQSLNIMLNEIDKQMIIPKEWTELIIK